MKYGRLPTRAWLVIAGMTLASCASIVEGTDQTITVRTEPSQASCTLTQEGIEIAAIGSTPGTITLDKSAEILSIECNRDGYFTEIASVASSFADMTFGNIIFGGIIGVGIDAASGAMHNYPEQVTVLLTPTAFESEKARDDFFANRREFLISEAERSTAKIRKNCLPELKADCDDDIEELEQALNKKLEIVGSQKANAKIVAANALAGPVVSGSNIDSRETAKIEKSSTPVNIAATRSTPKQIAARPDPTANAASPNSLSLLSYWRLRDDILRRAIATETRVVSAGLWNLAALKVVSASPDKSNGKLLTLATAYTLERNPSYFSGGLLADSVRLQRTITVNIDTETVIKVGKPQRIK